MGQRPEDHHVGRDQLDPPHSPNGELDLDRPGLRVFGRPDPRPAERSAPAVVFVWGRRATASRFRRVGACETSYAGARRRGAVLVVGTGSDC